jgi:hypothetical protein
LKQARQRASRLVLNDGARSSLPQYRQINFSPSGFARDDRPLLVFEASAPFGLAAAVFFLAEADASLAINSPAVGSVAVIVSILLLWPRLGRSQPHCSDAARWEAGFGTLCGRKKSESPSLNPPTRSPRLRSHGVGPREIARREDSRNLGDLRPRRLSLGPPAKAKRGAHGRISLNSLKYPIIERLIGG